MIDKMIKAVKDNDINGVQKLEQELLQLPVEDAYKIITDFKGEEETPRQEYYDFAKMTPKKEIFWKVLEYSRAKRDKEN